MPNLSKNRQELFSRALPTAAILLNLGSHLPLNPVEIQEHAVAFELYLLSKLFYQYVVTKFMLISYKRYFFSHLAIVYSRTKSTSILLCNKI